MEVDVEALLRLAATSPLAAAMDSGQQRAELSRRGLGVVGVAGCALAVQGQLEAPADGANSLDGVAVVGARASDPYGLTLARQLGRELAEAGLTVISGGAEGCDAAAHEGALEAGGRTVVVLPSGHDRAYPTRHRDLFRRAAERGAVVSPFWPTTTVARSRFLSRNRVIAALSRAVVVVRAQARSGSLSTAQSARALGRPVGAVVGPVGDALSEGCHLLLDEGATAIGTRRGLGQWLDRVVGRRLVRASRPWPVRATGLPAPWADVGWDARDGPGGEPRGLGDEATSAAAEAQLRGLVAMVAREPGLDLDAITVRSALPFESLVGCLLDLELRGILERMPGGRYRITGRGV